MQIQVSEILYHHLSPEQFAMCPLYPALSRANDTVNIFKQTNNATLNAGLRHALTLAIGRGYSLPGGPVTATADGKKPTGAVNYTFKAFRMALQDKAASKDITDLGAGALGDWDGQSRERYQVFSEDTRLALQRRLCDVPRPLPDLWMPYRGDAPPNLEAVSSHPVDTIAAVYEWSNAICVSADPNYKQGTDMTVAGMMSRIKQFIRIFQEEPKPVPGVFSVRPWGVVPALLQYPVKHTAPSQTVMHDATQLIRSLSLGKVALPCLEVAVASGAAMAVALGCVAESAADAAVSSVVRELANRHGLKFSLLQCAAHAALAATTHHQPTAWPMTVVKVVSAVTGVVITPAQELDLSTMLSAMRVSSLPKQVLVGQSHRCPAIATAAATLLASSIMSPLHSASSPLDEGALTFADVPTIVLSPPLVKEKFGPSVPLKFPHCPELEGIYPRFALYWGLIDGWPPLRKVFVEGDPTWQRGGSLLSIIKKVVETISKHVGISLTIPIGQKPSESQILAAYKYNLELSNNTCTNSFSKYYDSLALNRTGLTSSSSAAPFVSMKATAVSGSKRSRSQQPTAGATGCMPTSVSGSNPGIPRINQWGTEGSLQIAQMQASIVAQYAAEHASAASEPLPPNTLLITPVAVQSTAAESPLLPLHASMPPCK